MTNELIVVLHLFLIPKINNILLSQLYNQNTFYEAHLEILARLLEIQPSNVPLFVTCPHSYYAKI
jgi:hypothetical protein